MDAPYHGVTQGNIENAIDVRGDKLCVFERIQVRWASLCEAVS
jgi:hypothetical protein